jgi:phosphoribosyl 1,2-cyclic phosphate phosphodiesterase
VRLRFLGTGTSFGTPVLGCSCAVCASPDPRDRRGRHGALLESGDGRSLLIDTPPELRLQLLHAGVRHVDAVWFTHEHADHTHGIDDLRAFSVRRASPLPVYAAPACAATLRTKFSYIFNPAYAPPEGTTKPELDLRTFATGKVLDIVGFRMLPLEVPHGDLPVHGFRCGELGYITDAKVLPAATAAALQGVRILVLNALWFGHPHPTHFNVEEAVHVARQLGAERTYLTHLTHRTRHQELLDRLPDGIEPAYDGLAVEI